MGIRDSIAKMMVEDDVQLINDCEDIGTAAMYCASDLDDHKSSYERSYLKSALRKKLRRETDLDKVYVAFQNNYRKGVRDREIWNSEWQVSQILGSWLREKGHLLVREVNGDYIPESY